MGHYRGEKQKKRQINGHFFAHEVKWDEMKNKGKIRVWCQMVAKLMNFNKTTSTMFSTLKALFPLIFPAHFLLELDSVWHFWQCKFKENWK